MRLFHGSFLEISRPDLRHSRKNLDFGSGFYVTPIFDQAKNWAERFKRKGKEGVVSCYNFSEEEAFRTLQILKFDKYSEEWIDHILSCRQGYDQFPFDIVMGGVANDKVFNTIELYFDGLIEKTEAIKRLQYDKLNMQYCFRTEVALSLLVFEWSEKMSMTANPILLQKKYARIVKRFAEISGITLPDALDFFYHSMTYELMREGISDMHCRSDEYLAEELCDEYTEHCF